MSVKTQLIDALYRKIPKLECKGLCGEACGPIAASRAEIERLESEGGRKLKVDGDLVCSMLEGGKCVAYRARPAICRLWGVVKALRCPHGCEPERWLEHAEGQRILRQADRIGGAS